MGIFDIDSCDTCFVPGKIDHHATLLLFCLPFLHALRRDKRESDVYLGSFDIEQQCITYHRLAGPVEFLIVDKTPFLVQVVEEIPQVLVVGRLEEIQSTHVSQVRSQFFGMPLAKNLDWCVPLRIADLLISFFQRVRFQPLPRKATTQEVHQHVAQRF